MTDPSFSSASPSANASVNASVNASADASAGSPATASPRTPVKLVVGLGNPGPEYAATRHNIGFRVVERVAERLGARFAPDPALRGRIAFGGSTPGPCALLEPETFMNRSGESVAAALSRWPSLVAQSDLLVVYDDLDLPPGRLRLRPGGGAGGHRGMTDIVRRLGHDRIARLRFGIGHPGRADAVVGWVLEPFAQSEEQAILPAAIERAADAALCFLELGIAPAMDRFNAPVELSGPETRP